MIMFGLPYREHWSADGLRLEVLASRAPDPVAGLAVAVAAVGLMLCGLEVGFEGHVRPSAARVERPLMNTGCGIGSGLPYTPPRPEVVCLPPDELLVFGGPGRASPQAVTAATDSATTPPPTPGPVDPAPAVVGLLLAIAGTVAAVRRFLDANEPVVLRVTPGWVSLDGRVFAPGTVRRISERGSRILVELACGGRCWSRRIEPLPPRLLNLLGRCAIDGDAPDLTPARAALRDLRVRG